MYFIPLLYYKLKVGGVNLNKINGMVQKFNFYLKNVLLSESKERTIIGTGYCQPYRLDRVQVNQFDYIQG